ncbi:MAG: hypothetical protein ACOYNZ_07135 [Rhodoferax sp.]
MKNKKPGQVDNKWDEPECKSIVEQLDDILRRMQAQPLSRSRAGSA